MRRYSCLLPRALLGALRHQSTAVPPSASIEQPAAEDAQTHASHAASPPPAHRRVGNIFIVHCIDHPFKYAWEVNRMLRDLRIEFKGQTVIVPDVPIVRKQLWRVRQLVRVDMLDLDEAKALVGIPEHITFTDLQSQISPLFGRIRGMPTPGIRSRVYFMRYRRMRMRDVLQRDQLEKQLLEERRKLLRMQESEENNKKEEEEDGREGENAGEVAAAAEGQEPQHAS